MTTHIYTRVSTSKQADEGHSLSAQRTRAEAYVTYKALPSPLVYYEERAVSAAKLRIGMRPQGSRLCLALTPGDHVVVVHLDRAWRSAADALSMIEAWHQIKITVHILNCEIDTSSPSGKLMFTILAGVAEMERSLLSERTKAGLAGAAAKGIYTNRAPYGFEHDGTGRIRPLADPLPLLSSCAVLYLQRLGYMAKTERCRILTEAGLPTPSGHPWSLKLLSRLTERAGPHRDLLSRTLADASLRLAFQEGELRVFSPAIPFGCLPKFFPRNGR